MTRRSLDTRRSSLSNPVDEAHVPRTGPGTPQANGRSEAPGRPVRPAARPSRGPPAPTDRLCLRAVSPAPCVGQSLRSSAGASPGPWTRLPGPGHSGEAPDKQTHRWPLDGQSAPPGQRCDPAGPAAVARASKRTLGRSAQTPLRWGVTRHNAARGEAPPRPRKGDDPGSPLNQRTPVRAY